MLFLWICNNINIKSKWLNNIEIHHISDYFSICVVAVDVVGSTSFVALGPDTDIQDLYIYIISHKTTDDIQYK